MVDEEIRALIQAEINRQSEGLEMIPSENHTSPEVLNALGSRLTDKYSEGYPGMRYYGGCEVVDKVENLARERAKKLFGVDHAKFSRIPARRPTRRFTLRWSTRAIPLWAWPCTSAGIWGVLKWRPVIPVVGPRPRARGHRLLNITGVDRLVPRPGYFAQGRPGLQPQR